jgi:50S ribosomal protein L16 3-hydroxylase
LSINSLSADFNRREFLERYWQKEPLLIRQLVPQLVDPLTPEELAGCACEELVESRVITEFETENYALRNGPFEENDFTSLPSTRWTLLVQAMDQWFDEVADLRKQFDFIPSWRVDDVMISFACKNGGVGPHFDNYDVFLLQGQGQRKWRLGQRCDDATPLRKSTELRLLESFETTEEFILNPGDALYVPPRIAHWGISLDDSLCYSIGFRAPSHSEMIEGFSDFLIQRSASSERFEDPITSPPEDPAKIPTSSLTASFHALRAKLDNEPLFRQWFGCHVTQPKYPELIARIDRSSEKRVDKILKLAENIRQNPSSRFAYMVNEDSATDSVHNSINRLDITRKHSETAQSITLFVDGNAAVFDLKNLSMISRLCEPKPLERRELESMLAHKPIRELLKQLIVQGSLILE